MDVITDDITVGIYSYSVYQVIKRGGAVQFRPTACRLLICFMGLFHVLCDNYYATVSLQLSGPGLSLFLNG